MTIYHTLSIWLEVEFGSDVFLKTSFCAHYSQIIFKNKKNQYLYNQITQENFLGEHFLIFVAFGILFMSKKGLFSFTSRKSPSLYSIFTVL